jgi:hypothetical protein
LIVGENSGCTVDNGGLDITKPTIIINGGAINPTVRIGNKKLYIDTAILKNEKAIIDCETHRTYLARLPNALPALHSITDEVFDTLGYTDSGMWVYNQKTFKIVFEGDESAWQLLDAGTDDERILCTVFYGLTPSSKALSSHFKWCEPDNRQNGCFTVDSSGFIQIFLHKNSFSSAAEFKEWVGTQKMLGKPLTFICERSPEHTRRKEIELGNIYDDNLKMFKGELRGVSTQNGTPTIDNPVEIVSEYAPNIIGTLQDITNRTAGEYPVLNVGGNEMIITNADKVKIYWNENYLLEPTSEVLDFQPEGFEEEDTIYVYDYKLYPFNLYIDGLSSQTIYAPTTSNETLSNGNIDGEIDAETKYENRVFVFECFSEDGLTEEEKMLQRTRVANTLHKIRNRKMKLYFVDANVKFEVRFAGVDYENGVGFTKYSISFETTTPYAFVEKGLNENGYIENNGIMPSGLLITITGGFAWTPKLRIGSTLLQYNDYINAGETLIIDTDKKTCTLILTNGEKVNVKKNFNGKYPLIPVGITAVEKRDNINIILKERHIW